MGSQVYRDRYLAALEVAHSDVDQITEQFEMLQLRRKQLEHVLGALEDFLGTNQQGAYELHQPEPSYAEPVNFEPVQPVLRAVPASEPVTPAAFSPMPEPILDPIQNRINRALGLAVA
jgi:hypothetical protein